MPSSTPLPLPMPMHPLVTLNAFVYCPMDSLLSFRYSVRSTVCYVKKGDCFLRLKFLVILNLYQRLFL